MDGTGKQRRTKQREPRPRHPPTKIMVLQAINCLCLDQKNGATLAGIKSYIHRTFGLDKSYNTLVKNFVKKGINENIITSSTGINLNGRMKINHAMLIQQKEMDDIKKANQKKKKNQQAAQASQAVEPEMMQEQEDFMTIELSPEEFEQLKRANPNIFLQH